MTAHNYTDELVEVNSRLRVCESYLERQCAENMQLRDDIQTFLKQSKALTAHAKLLADATRRLIGEKEFLQRCLGIQAQQQRVEFTGPDDQTLRITDSILRAAAKQMRDAGLLNSSGRENS